MADKETNIDESFVSRDTVDHKCVSSTIEEERNFYLRTRPLLSNNNYMVNTFKGSVIEKKTMITRITTTLVTIFTSILAVFRYSYNKQSSAVSWIGKRIHQVASRVLLLDTYLQRRRSGASDRRASGILLLCLIPLMIFGGG